MEYESYEIVKYDEDTFDNLNGYDVVDDPDFEGNVANDEPFPFQLLGMMYSHQCETWYEVIAGFRTEDQAKRYVEAIEQADLLKAQIDKSLDSTLETIQKQETQLCPLCHVLEGDGSCCGCLEIQRDQGRYEGLWDDDEHPDT